MAADGTFSAKIRSYARDGEDIKNGRAPDVSWALVLRNDTVFATERMAGIERIVNIPGAGESALVGQRPAELAAGASVDLGDVDAEGKAETMLSDLDSLFADESNSASVADIAKTNRSLGTLVNVVANANPEAKTYWEFIPFFSWGGAASAVKNVYSQPADVVYDSMGVYITVNDPEKLTFDEVCSESSVLLEIVPPADVAYGEMTFGPNNPISNAGHSAIASNATSHSTTRECGNQHDSTSGPLFVRSFSTDGDRFLFNTTIDDTPPEGAWSVHKDGTSIAQFNLSPASPFDSVGHPVVYIPSLKVTTDQSGVITAVHVKFYAFESGQFVEVSDLTAFRKVVTSVNYGLDDSDGASAGGLSSMQLYEQLAWPASGAEFSTTEIPYEFLYADQTSETKLVAGSINISYDMYGNRYRFDFRHAVSN